MNKKQWETPRCNNCRSNKLTILLKDLTYWEYPGKFRIVQCNKCNLVFVSPRPVIDEMGKYYTQKFYWGRDFCIDEAMYNEKKERENAYGPIYGLIARFKKRGAILDIGAGTGLFLSKYKDERWKLDGVELSGDAVEYAYKTYKIKLKKGDFLDFRFRKSYFDVVTLNGVLEHLHDPLRTLKGIYNNLKDDGILVFTVPNFDSFGRKIFGRDWLSWQPPRHLYQFSEATIKYMLPRAKFEVIEIKHNYWLHNYYMLFQSFRYSKSPRFKKRESGGLKEENYKSRFSLIKECGKIYGKIFAYIVALLEQLFRRGEVMIVYARKKY